MPHLGFAYQELGDYDKAIATFDEAHRLAPNDTSITAYLVQANLSAKKYGAALDLARKARVQRGDDLRFARLEAQALRQSGKPDEAVSLLQEFTRKQSDKPEPYVALAQLYSETKRGGDAVKVLQEAQSKFPADTTIPFELGAVFDKQKKFADAESAFRQVLSKEPDNAPALNYLGYMLADRGERLDESVTYLKKALAIEPDNGSYLDSLGWAYYKGRQARSGRRQPAARRRTAEGQLGHSGSLRRRALQALALRRCDCRVDARHRRRRRFDRSRVDRQEDPLGEAKTRQEMTRGGGRCWRQQRSSRCRAARRS